MISSVTSLTDMAVIVSPIMASPSVEDTGRGDISSNRHRLRLSIQISQTVSLVMTKISSSRKKLVDNTCREICDTRSTTAISLTVLNTSWGSNALRTGDRRFVYQTASDSPSCYRTSFRAERMILLQVSPCIRREAVTWLPYCVLSSLTKFRQRNGRQSTRKMSFLSTTAGK